METQDDGDATGDATGDCSHEEDEIEEDVLASELEFDRSTLKYSSRSSGDVRGGLGSGDGQFTTVAMNSSTSTSLEPKRVNSSSSSTSISELDALAWRRMAAEPGMDRPEFRRKRLGTLLFLLVEEREEKGK